MNILENIDEYLNSDIELINLLEHSKSDNKIKIFRGKPFSTDTNSKNGSLLFPYIVFENSPYNMNLVTTEHRLKFSIVSDRLYLLEDIVKRLQDLLHFRNRKPLKINNLTILNSRQMIGGNFLYHEDLNAYEQSLYFLLTVKG